jgi:hypothetical protein
MQFLHRIHLGAEENEYVIVEYSEEIFDGDAKNKSKKNKVSMPVAGI